MIRLSLFQASWKFCSSIVSAVIFSLNSTNNCTVSYQLTLLLMILQCLWFWIMNDGTQMMFIVLLTHIYHHYNALLIKFATHTSVLNLLRPTYCMICKQCLPLINKNVDSLAKQQSSSVDRVHDLLALHYLHIVIFLSAEFLWKSRFLALEQL